LNYQRWFSSVQHNLLRNKNITSI